MILPFSSSRSRTSLSSNCLYCASFTPRAMFSKSMNIASFRSPFIPMVLSVRSLYGATPCARKLLGALYSGRDATREDRSRARRARSARSDPHGQVARAHVRPHAALRSGPLDVSLLRARGARDDVDLARVSEAAAGH